VIARGSEPIPAAIKAFHRLVDDRGHTRLPVAFVTNSLNRNADRAKQLSTMLGVQVWNAADAYLQFLYHKKRNAVFNTNSRALYSG